MASRRNSSAKIYVNGKVADGLYGLARRVGGAVSRYSQASQRAQASLARKVQPTAKAELRRVYSVKAGDLNKRMRLESGNRKNSDYIALWASTRKISLIAFAGRWGGTRTVGATAAILQGQRKTYDHAFIAEVGWRGTSGKAIKADTLARGIYVRSTGPNGRRVGRGPLRRLYGPSVFDMVATTPRGGSDSVRNAIVPQLESFYVSELSRQIALELRRG